MRTKNFKAVIFAITCAAITFCACSEKDLYEPTVPTDEPKSESDYFDFSTRADVTLNIDYGYPGYKAPFSLYAENPLESDGVSLKAGITPIYSAFTFENNTFSATVQLPSSIKKVYLYTIGFGLPTCVDLNVVGNSISFKNSVPATTRSGATSANVEHINIGNRYTTVNTNYKLYALYNKMDESTFYPSNSYITDLYSQIGVNENISSTSTFSTIGALNSRVVKVLRTTVNNNDPKQDNSSLVKEADITNISIKKYKADGTTEVKSAHIDLVTLSSNPGESYHNTLGYYYYKTGTELTAAQVKALPKFMAFPKLLKGRPAPGFKVRLQFFGENYNEQGVDDFPSGYTIGWCMIPNIGGGDNLRRIHSNMVSALEQKKNKVVYSNYFPENQIRAGFITLQDEKSGKLVIGIEDTAGDLRAGEGFGDNSYEDMLFYVDADPMEAITGTDKPIIKDEEVISTETTTGILAFEDIWPSGGDYDMNDVVIKYSTVVSYNQDNEVKKIVDTFTPIHDGAEYKNGFGYVINNAVGNIVAEESNYLVQEESNQFMFFANAKDEQNKTFTLTREFEDDYPSKVTLVRDYNPFIAVKYSEGIKERTEVHLPKKAATSWASQNQIASTEHAYYIDKDGEYPFAIDLPVSTFKVPVERIVTIGQAYSKFDNWVSSNGSLDADWYYYPNIDKVQN